MPNTFQILYKQYFEYYQPERDWSGKEVMRITVQGKGDYIVCGRNRVVFFRSVKVGLVGRRVALGSQKETLSGNYKGNRIWPNIRNTFLVSSCPAMQ